MQIPSGNFGGVLPQPGPTVSVPRVDTASGLQDLGRATGQIAQNELQLDRANIVAQQRTRSLLALSRATNDAHDLHDQVARGVLDGSIAPDQAPGQLREGIAKITQTHVDGMPQLDREHIEAAMVGTGGGLERQLMGVVVKRQQNETLSSIDAIGEEAQRDAVRKGPEFAAAKYGAVLDMAGSSAGLTAAQIAAKKQAFKEHAAFNFYDAAGTDALTRGDVAGVTGVLQKVQGPDGDTMDPLKRIKLTHQLYGYQQHLLAQQQRAQNAAEEADRIRFNEAADVYNKALDLTLTGQYLSPDYIKVLTDKTTGTPLQEQAVRLLSSQSAIAGFASKPLVEREAAVERSRAAAATPGVGTDPEESKALSLLEKINSHAKAAADENPWAAAQKFGVIKDAPLLAAGNVGDFIPILQSRMQQISTVENWAGRKISPLQPQEADQLAKGIKTLPPDQAATLLGNIGQVVGDSERVAALAHQVHDKDGTLGLAMSFANAQTTQGRYTAELVLRGAQAEKDGTIKVDGTRETGWKAAIAKQVRGAYSNQEVEDQVVRAAYLVAGATDGDVDRAVRLASGGIIDFNGSKVPMPYGMTTEGQSSGESKFRKAVAATPPESIVAQTGNGFVKVGPTAMSVMDFVKALPDAKLAHAGQGMYAVRAGTGLVTNDAGRPILLQVKP